MFFQVENLIMLFLLKALHWIPIIFQINLKLVTTIKKSLHDLMLLSLLHFSTYHSPCPLPYHVDLLSIPAGPVPAYWNALSTSSRLHLEVLLILKLLVCTQLLREASPGPLSQSCHSVFPVLFIAQCLP